MLPEAKLFGDVLYPLSSICNSSVDMIAFRQHWTFSNTEYDAILVRTREFEFVMRHVGVSNFPTEVVLQKVEEFQQGIKQATSTVKIDKKYFLKSLQRIGKLLEEHQDAVSFQKDSVLKISDYDKQHVLSLSKGMMCGDTPKQPSFFSANRMAKVIQSFSGNNISIYFNDDQYDLMYISDGHACAVLAKVEITGNKG